MNRTPSAQDLLNNFIEILGCHNLQISEAERKQFEQVVASKQPTPTQQPTKYPVSSLQEPQKSVSLPKGSIKPIPNVTSGRPLHSKEPPCAYNTPIVLASGTFDGKNFIFDEQPKQATQQGLPQQRSQQGFPLQNSNVDEYWGPERSFSDRNVQQKDDFSSTRQNYQNLRNVMEEYYTQSKQKAQSKQPATQNNLHYDMSADIFEMKNLCPHADGPKCELGNRTGAVEEKPLKNVDKKSAYELELDELMNDIVSSMNNVTSKLQTFPVEIPAPTSEPPKCPNENNPFWMPTKEDVQKVPQPKVTLDTYKSEISPELPGRSLPRFAPENNSLVKQKYSEITLYTCNTDQIFNLKDGNKLILPKGAKFQYIREM
jgi:hypothetical protein